MVLFTLGKCTSSSLGQLLLGLINGAFYAMLSLGLAVIFGMLNVINFTHGAQYMMGAFAAWLGASDVRGVLVRSGKDTAFCAGADLTELGVAYDMIVAAPARDRFNIAFDHFFPLSAALRALEVAGKPVASAIAGLALGGTWASDRPFMLRLTPPSRVGEFYGLYNMVGRFAAVTGPFLWAAIVGWVFRGRPQIGQPVAVASLAVLVVVGYLILRPVSDAPRDWHGSGDC